MGSIKRGLEDEYSYTQDNSRSGLTTRMATPSNNAANGSKGHAANLLLHARTSGLLSPAGPPNIQSLGTGSPRCARIKPGSGRIPKYSDRNPEPRARFENDRKRRKLEGDRRSPVRQPSPNTQRKQPIKPQPIKNKNKSTPKPGQKLPGISAIDPKYVENIIEEALAHPTGPNAPSQNSIPKFPTIPKPKNYPPPLPPIHDQAIEQLCFTHRSYSHDPNNNDITASIMNYERLEFLGDSYMNYCVTKLLYKHLPHLREGELTRFRSQIVSNDNIWHYAMMYGFKERMLLGSGAEKDEVREEGKAVADIFESYIGGILTDQPETGEAIVYKWMAEITAPQILETEKIAAKMATLNKHAKQELYVLLDTEKLPAPVYVTTKQGSTVLDFEVACMVMGKEMGRGVGKNKNEAGTRAAMQAIEKLRAARAAGATETASEDERGNEHGKSVGAEKEGKNGKVGESVEEKRYESSLEKDSDNDSLSEGEIIMSD